MFKNYFKKTRIVILFLSSYCMQSGLSQIYTLQVNDELLETALMSTKFRENLIIEKGSIICISFFIPIIQLTRYVN